MYVFAFLNITPVVVHLHSATLAPHTHAIPIAPHTHAAPTSPSLYIPSSDFPPPSFDLRFLFAELFQQSTVL